MHGMDGSSFNYVNPPNKNASEKVITAEPHQSENAKCTIIDENMVIIEATPQVQNAKESSIEWEKEDVNIANGSTLEKV